MLITLNSSELIENLVALADGDVSLVHQAIRETADAKGAADLEKVVAYIMERTPLKQHLEDAA